MDQNKSRSLRLQAYGQIRSQLILGTLPAGSKISEPKLAKSLGIGRTPIREAIQQLEVEGLVERTARRGTFVTIPERKDVVELFELREAVEGYAVRLAAERINEDDTRQLYRMCDVLDELALLLGKSPKATLSGEKLRQFLTVDMGFHMLLISAAGNQRLIRIISDSQALSRIFGTVRQDHTADIVARAASNHRDIVDALKPSNGEQARTIMEAHIRESRDQALEHFDHKQRDDERLARGIDQFRLPQELLEEFDRMGVSIKSSS